MGTLPTSFDIEVSPLSQSWDEGRGIDTENWADKGVANWDKASTSVWWTTLGADFLTTPTASYHFDTGGWGGGGGGLEDVEVDVSEIVGAWLTGGLPNYGFMVKLTTTEEDDSNDYFKKKFHGRATHFPDKRPTVEMQWDDSIKDDRGVFLFDYSSSLYLYNKKRGELQDITGIGTGNDVLTVKIADLSGTIATVSASHTGQTGIYSASIVLATGSHSGSSFSDKWSFAGASYMTGSFTPGNDGASTSNVQEQYTVKVMNLKQEYELSEVVRWNLFVKTRNYNPAVVQTGSLVLRNTIIEKGYYRIDNALNGRHVIQLGTGSTETTRLSYDENGNYFNFYLSTLSPNEVYKLVFFFDVDGQLQKVDNNIRFKVK